MRLGEEIVCLKMSPLTSALGIVTSNHVVAASLNLKIYTSVEMPTKICGFCWREKGAEGFRCTLVRSAWLIVSISVTMYIFFVTSRNLQVKKYYT